MNIDNKNILTHRRVYAATPAAVNELEVHRRDICAQHVSQAQQ
jgi:hypothetical protein